MSGQRPPAPESGQRASDADRDRVIEVLADATAAGRLTLEEYSERSGTALSARTQGELALLTTDIPAPAASVPVPAAEQITAVLGNESRKGAWVVPARLSVRSVLGDCHLELQRAVLRQHVTVIDVTVRLGSVTIFVPEGIEVRLSGRAVLGAKSAELPGEPRPGAPVIEVRCDVLAGAVTVRRPKRAMRLPVGDERPAHGVAVGRKLLDPHVDGLSGRLVGVHERVGDPLHQLALGLGGLRQLLDDHIRHDGFPSG